MIKTLPKHAHEEVNKEAKVTFAYILAIWAPVARRRDEYAARAIHRGALDSVLEVYNS